MKKVRLLLLPMALLAGSAFAQGTITAGTANYVHTASHWDTSPETNFTGVGTGDQLFESGWFFRIQGDVQETVFPTPTTVNYTSPTATISWTNMGGRNIDVVKTHTITSAGAGQGEVGSTVQVTNNTGAEITLHLFSANDFDVNGSAGTDNAILVAPNNYIRINDATAGQCEYRAPGAINYAIRPFAAATDVFALLSNAAVNDLDNTGAPFGPGDITAAFQWTLTLPSGASGSVQVFQACNTTATPVSLQRFEVE